MTDDELEKVNDVLRYVELLKPQMAGNRSRAWLRLVESADALGAVTPFAIYQQPEWPFGACPFCEATQHDGHYATCESPFKTVVSE